MAVHHTEIERYPGTLDQLATELGNLRYDALGTFLRSLADKLNSDSIADSGRSRAKLADALREAGENVARAGEKRRAGLVDLSAAYVTRE